MKQVKLSDTTDTQLLAIKAKRVTGGEIIKTKQDIIADLVNKAFKREVK